jgi:hypothetical protein
MLFSLRVNEIWAPRSDYHRSHHTNISSRLRRKNLTRTPQYVTLSPSDYYTSKHLRVLGSVLLSTVGNCNRELTSSHLTLLSRLST